jgi:hypothetical protein
MQSAAQTVALVVAELAEVIQVRPQQQRIVPVSQPPPQLLQNAKEEKDAVLQRNRSTDNFPTPKF